MSPPSGESVIGQPHASQATVTPMTSHGIACSVSGPTASATLPSTTGRQPSQTSKTAFLGTMRNALAMSLAPVDGRRDRRANLVDQFLLRLVDGRVLLPLRLVAVDQVFRVRLDPPVDRLVEVGADLLHRLLSCIATGASVDVQLRRFLAKDDGQLAHGRRQIDE